jgi:hypothetical protein
MSWLRSSTDHRLGPALGPVLSVIVIALWTAVAMAAAVDEPTAIDQATEAVYADSDYQLEVPRKGTDREVQGGARRTAQRQRDGSKRRVLVVPTEAVFGLQAVFWVVVVGGLAALVLWAVGDRLPGRFGEAARSRTGDGDGEVEDGDDGVVSSADAHARAGDYTNAVREGLRLALAELQRREVVTVNASTTAREVLRQVRSAREVARPLAVLVNAVEQSVFGTMVLGEADYRRCREALGAILNGGAA